MATQDAGASATPSLLQVPMVYSFSDNMRAQGLTPGRRIEVAERVPVPGELAPRLELDLGCEVAHLLRVLLVDDEPIGTAETWLPGDLTVDLDLDPDHLGAASLYAQLQAEPVGLDLYSGSEAIRARAAVERTASLLQLQVGAPVLVVDRTVRSRAGRVVEATTLTWAADRYEYVTSLDRPSGYGRPLRPRG